MVDRRSRRHILEARARRWKILDTTVMINQSEVRLLGVEDRLYPLILLNRWIVKCWSDSSVAGTGNILSSMLTFTTYSHRVVQCCRCVCKSDLWCLLCSREQYYSLVVSKSTLSLVCTDCACVQGVWTAARLLTRHASLCLSVCPPGRATASVCCGARVASTAAAYNTPLYDVRLVADMYTANKYSSIYDLLVNLIKPCSLIFVKIDRKIY